MEPETTDEIRKALEAGTAFVENLKEGDVFLGAMAAAMAYSGKPADNLLTRIFLTAALDALDSVELYLSPNSHVINRLVRF